MEGIEGFRFYPTDEELILLLEEKRLHPAFSVHTILDYNIYEYEPFDLFGLPGVRHGEKWCNFYCAPDYMKKDSSQRLQQLIDTGYCDDSVRRATKTGYWKVTGEPRFIKAKGSKEVIGFKRTLVFYLRVPGSKEIRTNWVMREFVIRYNPSFKGDFVLCRIKWKRDKKPCTSAENEKKRAKKSRTSTKTGDGRAKKAHTSTKTGDGRAKKARTSTKMTDRQAKKARISAQNGTQVLKSRVPFNDEAQPSHNVVSNDGVRILIVENSSPESNWDAISNRNHVAENICPQLQPGAELLPVPGCGFTSYSGHQVTEAPEYTYQVDPLLHVEQNSLNGCSVLDQTTFFALQSLEYPELQPLPSCRSISNSGHQVTEAPEYTYQVDPLLHVEQDSLNGCSVLDQTTFFALRSLEYPELQPLPSCRSISNSGHHVAGAPQLVDPLLLSKPSVLGGCSGLDQTSFFPLESPVYPELQPVPSCELISNCRHHVVEAQDPRLLIPDVLDGCSGLDQTSYLTLQSTIYSCDLTSHSTQHVAEFPKYTSWQDTLPVIPSVLNGCSGLDQTPCFIMLSPIYPESQPLLSCDLTSNSAHCVAEAPDYTSQEDPRLVMPSVLNGCSQLDETSFSLQSPMYPESNSPPSCDSISNSGKHAAETPESTLQVDPLPHSKLHAFNSCRGLDQNTFSMHLEKEFSYSFTNSDYDVLNCPLGFEWELLHF